MDVLNACITLGDNQYTPYSVNQCVLDQRQRTFPKQDAFQDSNLNPIAGSISSEKEMSASIDQEISKRRFVGGFHDDNDIQSFGNISLALQEYLSYHLPILQFKMLSPAFPFVL